MTLAKSGLILIDLQATHLETEDVRYWPETDIEGKQRPERSYAIV